MSRRHGFIKAFEGSIRRKASSFFTIMSVAHVCDEELDGPASEEEVEKVLPTGDAYKGQLSADNLPHGYGKLAWTDGCTYVGQWRKGRAMGKGTFCWPSGATYEGDFKNGYLNGKGKYATTTGESYKGYWVMNMKHGHGTNRYANGDYYDGEWRRWMQDGNGRYQWRNGNCYVGQWRNGAMNGKGTLVWGNKNRYDGFWEDGCPKGNGTFKWADGSIYVGLWSTDPNEQNGTYYPSSMPTANSGWEPQQVYAVDLKACKISSCAKVSIFPSQKMPGDCRPKSSSRLSTDGDQRMSNCSWGSDAEYSRNVEDQELPRGLDSCMQRMTTRKQQGETISKGHKNYELMLKLQLGIRHSVGRPGPTITLDLRPSAFDPKEKLWTKFPPKGSKHTPPHPSGDFKWKDYCPLVFRTLRKLFKVDSADYMISICGNDALRELSSPGKSGSFFYLTHDDRYMIKTIKKAEVKVLLKMLPAYYNHVRSFESTLVTKFFGLHCVKVAGHSQNKVRFVIMGNLFCTDYPIHRRFDLKGSSHGRTTVKLDSEIDATATLKDLDLNFMFRLHKTWFQEFCRQVDRDCDFLEQEKIMDYSLLVGLHFRDSTEIYLSKADDNQLPFDPSRLSSIKLGISMPARVEKTQRKPDNETQLIGEPTGEMFEIILFFGIIDILQDYDISKKLEHAYKSMQYDPTSISAVDPKQYSRRFRDFIFKVFVEDT